MGRYAGFQIEYTMKAGRIRLKCFQEERTPSSERQPKKREKVLLRSTLAKKILKKGIKPNVKKVFDEDGHEIAVCFSVFLTETMKFDFSLIGRTTKKTNQATHPFRRC